MIKLIVGGIGSGKSLSAVKEIIHRECKTFTNFDVKHANTEKLLVDHIISDSVKRVKKSGEAVKELKVNWDFWNELVERNINFDICLDEIHNILNSRRSMSKWNMLVGTWLSQIRKILGDSETNHITAISQRVSGVDIILRDLMYQITLCQKWQGRTLIPTDIIKNGKLFNVMLPKTYVIKTVFKGEDCVQKYEGYLMGDKSYDGRFHFLANPYFRFYNSYQLIRFGESVYL